MLKLRPRNLHLLIGKECAHTGQRRNT